MQHSMLNRARQPWSRREGLSIHSCLPGRPLTSLHSPIPGWRPGETADDRVAYHCVPSRAPAECLLLRGPIVDSAGRSGKWAGAAHSSANDAV